MKIVVWIAMVLLIAGGAYVLKMKSDQVDLLSGALASRDATLRDLETRLKAANAKVLKDESALAENQKNLAAQSSAAQTAASHLLSTLTAAEQALANEQSHRRDLKAREDALNSSRHDNSDPSLSGHIQNDQTRLADLDRRLKTIEASEKNRHSTNASDAKVYQAQVKVEEKSLNDQIKEAKVREKGLQSQLKDKKRERFNALRDEQAGQIQQTLSATSQVIAQLYDQLHGIQAKDTNDLQANSYTQKNADQDDRAVRANLVFERTQVIEDLANLKSRDGLGHRETADLKGQLASLKTQEYESDQKIHALNQSIAQIKAQLAAETALVSKGQKSLPADDRAH